MPPRMLKTAALILALGATAASHAEVSRFELVSTQAGALEGRQFGNAGTAQKITAKATIAVDPADPRNAVIVDLDRAPRNAKGQVEAVADVTILRPAKPNGTLILEVPNRGRRLINMLVEEADAAASARLEKSTDAGLGFLLSQGYTIAWVGWQGDLTPDQGMRLSVPVVPNVTGPVRAEWIFADGKDPIRAKLPYPIADATGATLTVRGRPDDERQTPAGMGFRVIDANTIEIDRPAQAFGAKTIYELVYTARDPKVTGLAFAALRDVGSFLRQNGSSANPLAAGGKSTVDHSIGFGISQSGRVLRDFLYQGFNQDTKGRAVFDGMMVEIPGARRSYTNDRFAQIGRNPGPSEDRGYLTSPFPFTYALTQDSVTGKVDGLLRACGQTGTCPRIMHIDSEYEMWASQGSLLVTDAKGNHLDLPSNVRGYMIAGAPHFVPATEVSKKTAACTMPQSPISAGAPVRALLVALDEWVSDGIEPPASRFPTLAAGTLVPAAGLYGPIPGMDYTGKVVPAEHVVNGADGKPQRKGEYPVFVPRGDKDGNAVGGIRLPLVEAPRATYTGWNLRADGQELCTQQGSALPFAATRAERLANGDPRASIEERYPTADAYVQAVADAALRLQGARLLLPQDVTRMVEEARAGTLARLPATK